MAQEQLPRSRRLLAKHWHFGDQMPSLWCAGCPELNACGGLRVRRGLGTCLDDCCNSPDGCTRVCPNNPEVFADKLAEIGGTFQLDTLPRAPLLEARALPDEVPIIYHHGEIASLPQLPVACLPLYQMYTPGDGRPRFDSGSELRGAFGLGPSTDVMLTGVAQDKSVESWWGLGRAGRREVIRALVDQGVTFVTTPNFSLAADEPRWNDLHAISRAGIAHSEFLEGGLPAAYHINARTELDYERIAKFIGQRTEITHVAVEFLTGSGMTGRVDWSFRQLRALVTYVGRPLHLTFRGRVEHLSRMSKLFPMMTSLDADAFMKTVHFQRLVPHGNARLRPERATDADKAKLFEANWQARTALMRGMRFAA